MNLNKKIALITGGSKGIGKAIAQRFIKEGVKVIVFDIEEPDYEVEFYQVDISKEEQVEKTFAQIEQLDILVNNAGVYFQATIEETLKKELDKIIDINLKGTYLISKYAIPLIRKTKGNIINIASGLGIVPEPESPAYCATKAAIVMLTKCIAQKYASEGLRVNAILPGSIDTSMLRKSGASIEEWVKLCPMKMIGRPEDVANVAAFLASDDAKFVTGGLYSVDGGESTSSIYSK